MYLCTEGQVQVVPPAVDEKATFSITTAKLLERSQYTKRDESGSECAFFVQNDSINYFRKDNATITPIAHVNTPCRVIGSSLVFDYPKENALAIGTKWTVPATLSGCDISLPCEIVGFAEVAGHKTAKILAEPQLTVQEGQQHDAKKLPTSTEPTKENGGGSGATMTFRYQGPRDLSSVPVVEKPKGGTEEQGADIQKEMAQTVRLICYVDLTTGAVIRRELTRMYHYAKAPKNDETHITISQVLQG